MNTQDDIIETQADDVLERLRAAFLYTLSDGGRLLRQADVEHICPHADLCFDVSTSVRCGPCAARQSQNHGVTADFADSFSPAVWRMKRQVQAAENEIELLRKALQCVVEAHRHPTHTVEQKHNDIGDIVDRYTAWATEVFDPSLISLSGDGYLSYGGVDCTLSENSVPAGTLVRKVHEWALDNLSPRRDGRWRVRKPTTCA